MSGGSNLKWILQTSAIITKKVTKFGSLKELSPHKMLEFQQFAGPFL